MLPKGYRQESSFPPARPDLRIVRKLGRDGLAPAPRTPEAREAKHLIRRVALVDAVAHALKDGQLRAEQRSVRVVDLVHPIKGLFNSSPKCAWLPESVSVVHAIAHALKNGP